MNTTPKITPLGDRHGGKQTVLIETEQNAYIQKPRDCKTEEAFVSFCRQIAAPELGDVFARAPRVLSVGTDFHTQAVEQNDITTKDGVRLYYQRAGVLLFFSFLFASNDLHCENLIAAGDMPVLIDLETLLTGKVARTSETYNLSKSVMRSHLLCNFMNQDGKTVDVSGFSGTTAGCKNIPRTATGREHIWEHRETVLQAFETAYRFCMSRRDRVEKLLHLFDDCRFRQILRPTQTYASVARYVGSLGEGREDTAYALLSRAYKNDRDPERLAKAGAVLAEEVRAVLDGEIPLFFARGDSTDLCAAETVVFKDHLELSPVGYAVQRLYDLCEDDLQRQLAIIDLAIAASEPCGTRPVHINVGALASGEYCAERVTASAVPHLPSVFCELSADAKGNVSFVSAGFSLYAGLLGVLCMYAALFRRTGKAAYRDTLFLYYQKFADMMLCDSTPIMLTDKNASLSDGIIGMIACLRHIYELTEETVFSQAAHSIIERLTLAPDITNADYLGGFGALPLFLHKCRPNQNAPLFKQLAAVFESVQPYTTGAAHGASGLTLSLSAICAGFFQKSIAISLQDVLQWEENHFSPDDGNWYDLRDPSRKGFMSGWCSGAPGIGMARDMLMRLTDDRNVHAVCERDIERARAFLQKKTPCKRDSLCCGTASRLMAASRLGVRTDGLFRLLANAEKTGTLRLLHPADTNDTNVSLMQGLSGVAYALAMYGDPLSGGMLI